MADNVSKQDSMAKESAPPSFATLPRWWWIAMMAACLIGLCTRTEAQESSMPEMLPAPVTMQLDAVVPGPVELVGLVGEDTQHHSSRSRPAYVELIATLANFDRDSDTDGWIATIVLRDAGGGIVTMRSHATFELRPGRFAVDNVTFVAGESVTQRWSQPLEFDADGAARVRLELKGHKRTSVGHPEMTLSTPSRSQTVYHSGSPFETQRLTSADRFRYTRTDGFVGPDFPFNPVLGALRVRVSVPTQGTFDAVTVVPLHSPVVSIERSSR